MSEYIMNHTGEQLDEAISKVLNDYIKPEGTINITEKDNNTEVDVTKYALAKVQIPIPTFTTEEIVINPTESIITEWPTVDGFRKVTVNPISSTYIGSKVTRKSGETFTPKKDEQQVIPSGVYLNGNQIIDKIPEDYINLDNVIVHYTKSASGTFVGSNQTCEKLSIGGLSFRPKIVLIIATNPITTTNTSSPYDICAIWRIMDDNYSVLRDNCVFVYKSSSSVKSGHTKSNGLRGNADGTITGWGTSARFASGTTYSWYAWG